MESDIQANIAACYLAQGNYDLALSTLIHSISGDKDHTQSLFLCGLVYEAKGSFSNAIKYFEKAIKSDLTFVPGYLSLAVIKRNSG